MNTQTKTVKRTIVSLKLPVSVPQHDARVPLERKLDALRAAIDELRAEAVEGLENEARTLERRVDRRHERRRVLLRRGEIGQRIGAFAEPVEVVHGEGVRRVLVELLPV